MSGFKSANARIERNRSGISYGLGIVLNEGWYLPPTDFAAHKGDSLHVATQQRINEDDPYFMDVRGQWGNGLRNLVDALPIPEWQEDIAG